MCCSECQTLSNFAPDRFVVFIASGVSVEPTNVVLESIRSRRTSVSKDVKFVTIDLGTSIIRIPEFDHYESDQFIEIFCEI